MRRPASIRRALPRLVSRAALSLLLAGFLAGGPLHAEGGLKLAGAGGGSLDTSELEAGDAVVFVWASWSPRCRDIEQQVNAAQNRWSGRLRVVSVSFQEDGDTVSSFLAGKRLA
ncbi:MAG: hypothetical protein KDD11_14930, partial [Acidobacteria bacterium]|nr:hypothetical protein [Acidobacteriota bacterium]